MVECGHVLTEWRTVPVNVLSHEGAQYLVAPRGETQWVRNLRAAKTGELRLGRRVERFEAEEIADADKAPLLRAYLKKWAFEVNAFFEDVAADASDAGYWANSPTRIGKGRVGGFAPFFLHSFLHRSHRDAPGAVVLRRDSNG